MKYLDKSIEFDKYLLATPLTESAEGFLSVKNLCRKSHVHMAFSGGKNKSFWLRGSVARKLIKAAQMLNSSGYTLVLEDAYRSLKSQKKAFLTELGKVEKDNPGINKIKACQVANTFIAGIPILAAHTAGAAVDVTLLANTGKLADMGCPYLTLSEESITGYPEISTAAKANRQILVDAMESSGFSNYPFEYWHFSLGDVCDAYIKKKGQAVYGPVELDMKNGKILTTLSGSECLDYFK